VILPKTVVGGVAVIILAGAAVWKTATDGRAFHKNMQERCGCGVIIELVTMVIKLVTIGGLLLPQATSIATEQIKPAGY
jgi:uncharacterized membrane protein